VPYDGQILALYIDPNTKPSNVLVDYDPLDGHITNVQLADLESTVPENSRHAIAILWKYEIKSVGEND